MHERERTRIKRLDDAETDVCGRCWADDVKAIVLEVVQPFGGFVFEIAQINRGRGWFSRFIDGASEAN